MADLAPFPRVANGDFSSGLDHSPRVRSKLYPGGQLVCRDMEKFDQGCGGLPVAPPPSSIARHWFMVGATTNFNESISIFQIESILILCITCPDCQVKISVSLPLPADHYHYHISSSPYHRWPLSARDVHFPSLTASPFTGHFFSRSAALSLRLDSKRRRRTVFDQPSGIGIDSASRFS